MSTEANLCVYARTYLKLWVSEPFDLAWRFPTLSKSRFELEMLLKFGENPDGSSSDDFECDATQKSQCLLRQIASYVFDVVVMTV